VWISCPTCGISKLLQRQANSAIRKIDFVISSITRKIDHLNGICSSSLGSFWLISVGLAFAHYCARRILRCLSRQDLSLFTDYGGMLCDCYHLVEYHGHVWCSADLRTATGDHCMSFVSWR
jgi:hypothetical protein